MVLKILNQKPKHEYCEDDLRQLSLIRSMITANETALRLGNIDQSEYEEVNKRIGSMLDLIEGRYKDE